MNWSLTPLGNLGHQQKILSSGLSASVTHLLRVAPGGDTTEMDNHDHTKEVLILRGSVKNGEEFHPAGTYTCNPPHNRHGPLLIDEELVCLEIRNYD